MLRAAYIDTVSGTWCFDALFGTEQSALGSVSTVRGLAEPQVFGNRSLLLRNELGLHLPHLTDQPANCGHRCERYVASQYYDTKYGEPVAQ